LRGADWVKGWVPEDGVRARDFVVSDTLPLRSWRGARDFENRHVAGSFLMHLKTLAG
jgi:hypothetical protein